LPAAAPPATGDEPLAVEDLEYAGHAPHLPVEVPRVVGEGGGAAHPRRHLLSRLQAGFFLGSRPRSGAGASWPPKAITSSHSAR